MLIVYVEIVQLKYSYILTGKQANMSKLAIFAFHQN